MDKYEIFIPAGEKAVGQLKVKRLIDGLDEGKAWDIKITQHKSKRSLTSNSYAWVLMGQIAERIHESRIEVYRSYIRNIGDNSDVFVLDSKAVKRFIQTWQNLGIGYVCDIVTEYETENGQSKTEVMAYYGSHTYTQEQMNSLISLIVQDCETLGIPTKDPAELEKLVKEWGCE